jgi:hypothetical protein
MGRKRFDALMRAYLTECPSESFSLRNLGSRLESWLIRHPEATAPYTTLAIEMVQLEWSHIEAFDSAVEPLLGPDDLCSIDEHSVFQLQPYLRLLSLHYPVDDLLIELRSENGSSDTSSNNASIARRRKYIRRIASVPAEEIYLAVHRHQNSVYYKRLQREDFRLLAALLRGRSIGESIEDAFAGSMIPEEEHSAFLQQAFNTWAALGWFTK